MGTNKYFIYKCTNLINEKVYIGFTKNLEKRIREHKSNSFNPIDASHNHILHKAIRKYGWDNFTWDVIYQSLDGEHCLCVMEVYFIGLYNSYFKNGIGYNMTLGGQAVMLNKTHTDETKTKMKKAWETRDKTMSWTGKQKTEEHKKKLSLAAKRRPPVSEETKMKLRQKRAEQILDPEYSKRMSKSIKLSWIKRKTGE